MQRHFTLILLLALWPALSPVSQTPAPKATWVEGISEPINDVTLSSPTSGIVGQRLFKEGEFVKQGQPIVELDRKLEEFEVQRRKLVMDQRKTDLDSTRALFQKNSLSVSREEMDKRVAEYNLAVVEHELAKEQMGRRQVSAPFDGTVVELFLEVGEACQSQQPLARLVDARRCYFVVNIEGKSGYRLKVGQSVKIEIDAGASPEQFQGTVNFISPVVDPASGLLKIKVVFDNPDGKIRPGAAGKMLLEGSS